MAVATVVSPLNRAERISRRLGVYTGYASIATYTTCTACTAITRYFVPTSNGTTGGFTNGICSVDIAGPTSLGYIVKWDYTTGGFKAFYPSVGTTPTISVPVTSGTTAGGALFLTSGGGFSAITAGSVGCNVTAIVNAAGSEAGAVNIGTFGFVAIGFVSA